MRRGHWLLGMLLALALIPLVLMTFSKSKATENDQLLLPMHEGETAPRKQESASRESIDFLVSGAPISKRGRVQKPSMLQPNTLTHCVFQFQNSEGHRLEYVKVINVDSRETLGVTSKNGECSIDRADASGKNLAFLSEEYVPLRVRMPETLQEQAKFVLRGGWSVRGVVVDGNRARIGPGLNVYAVDPLVFFGTDSIELALSGNKVVSLGLTDAASEFNLTGLDPRKSYGLFAAGKGFVCYGRQFNLSVQTDDSPIEVIAKRVFGFRLNFHEEGSGDPIRLGADLEGDWHGRTSTSEHAHQIPSFPIMSSLLGLPPEYDSNESNYYNKVFFYTTDSGIEESLEVEFNAHFPGYEATSVQVQALHVSTSIQSFSIPLKCTADGFGSVQVVVSPTELAAKMFSSRTPGRSCSLRLQNAQSREVIEARIPSFEDGVALIPGIPYGSYETVFKGPHEFFQHPSNNLLSVITVGPLPSVVPVELQGVGGVEFEFQFNQSSGWNGSILGTQVRVSNGEMNAFHFFSSPYILPLLPAGKYEIEIDGLPEMGTLSRSVDVIADQIQKLTVLIP